MEGGRHGAIGSGGCPWFVEKTVGIEFNWVNDESIGGLNQ